MPICLGVADESVVPSASRLVEAGNREADRDASHAQSRTAVPVTTKPTDQN